MNESKPYDYRREVAEARIELMLLKSRNYPNVSRTFIKNMAVVLRLQELEEEQATTTFT